MDRSTDIFVFGDQTAGFEAGLRRLLHKKDNALLSSFFERVHYVLRLEIGHLSASQQEQFPRFISLLDLLGKYRELGSNPALESALVCAHQLACFIR